MALINVKDLGAKGNGKEADNDYYWFDKALTTLEKAGGGVLYVPAGDYILSQTLRIKIPIILKGDGGNLYASSLLRFPAKVDGIVVEASAAGPSGAGTIIRDLQISCVSAPPVLGHNPELFLDEEELLTGGPYADAPLTGSGIVLHARARIVSCYVAAFYYDGIHIESADYPKDAEGFEVHNCNIGSCGRHAIYIAGPKSGYGRIIGCPLGLVNGWAVYDASPSGNTYVACQTESCGRFATRIGALAISAAAPDVLWAGTDDGGVFRSANRGLDWVSYNGGLSGVAPREAYARVRALVFAPGDAEVDRPYAQGNRIIQRRAGQRAPAQGMPRSRTRQGAASWRLVSCRARRAAGLRPSGATPRSSRPRYRPARGTGPH